MEKLYTVKEVADYLKVSNQSVYKYIDAGKLKATKIEGVVRIFASNLLEFVEGNKSVGGN